MSGKKSLRAKMEQYREKPTCQARTEKIPRRVTGVGLKG
jgi:hypothetical protein